MKKVKNLKINRVIFLVAGIIFIFFGLFAVPFLLVGAFLLFLSYRTNKAYKDALKKETPGTKEDKKEEITINVVDKQLNNDNEEIQPKETHQVEPVSEERLNELKQMCKDIHKEYKGLLKEYKNSDIEEKEYILSECYRKLTVIETTVRKYNCYEDIDIYDEYERIEKKARSFINAYIKDERETGSDDYMIDVFQFSNSLWFIEDYIWEKDKKLNKDI